MCRREVGMKYPYTLPELGYGYDALEPYIDEQTMIIHHTKHHQGYVDKLNKVLEKYPDLQNMDLEDILRNLESLNIEDKDKVQIRNNGGGHINHTLFWDIMNPNTQADESLKSEIEQKFDSVDNFKKEFSTVALSHFGSGWAYLARDEKGDLQVYSLPNQDSPYLLGHTPVIGLDVWEHAYYLKYQNRRAEYIENWWNVVKIL